MTVDQHVKVPFEAVVARHGATVFRVVRAVVGHADADELISPAGTCRVQVQAYVLRTGPRRCEVDPFHTNGVRTVELYAVDRGSQGDRRCVGRQTGRETRAPARSGLAFSNVRIASSVPFERRKGSATRRPSRPQ